jgi:hypothetical protein
MGAYTGTPTQLLAWEEGDRQGKYVCTVRRLSITLATQGGLTNTVSAVSLGFRSGGLISAQAILFTDGSSVLRAVTLMTDGTYLYVADPQVSTDADRGKAADVTGTLVCEVRGLS